MDEVSLLNFHGKKFIQEIRVARRDIPWPWISIGIMASRNEPNIPLRTLKKNRGCAREVKHMLIKFGNLQMWVQIAELDQLGTLENYKLKIYSRGWQLGTLKNLKLSTVNIEQ